MAFLFKIGTVFNKNSQSNVEENIVLKVLTHVIFKHSRAVFLEKQIDFAPIM
jgi:hypothetical protein